MQMISKQVAQAFAEALIANHGNATAAARTLEYEDAGNTGFRYARHPLVLAALAPLSQAHLNSLTPKAIQTLGALLNTGSAYVRLEAAKDILDRNGVGTSREPPRSQQLVVNINLQPSNTAALNTLSVIDVDEAVPLEGSEGAPLESSGSRTFSTSPAHDFSPEASPALVAPELLGGGGHDFSLGVPDGSEGISEPLATPEPLGEGGLGAAEEGSDLVRRSEAEATPSDIGIIENGESGAARGGRKFVLDIE